MKIKLSKLRQIIREELSPPEGTTLDSRSLAEATLEDADVQESIRDLAMSVTSALGELMGRRDMGELHIHFANEFSDAVIEMINDDLLQFYAENPE